MQIRTSRTVSTFGAVAALAMGGCTTTLTAPAVTATATPPAAAASAATRPTPPVAAAQPQPFATVIKDARRIDGLITAWQKD